MRTCSLLYTDVKTDDQTKPLRRLSLPGEECDICMLVRRKSAWSVEMLAVLVVLVTLVPTWSDGLLLTKCELKSQLEEAFSNLQVENAADIIAKLACTVENISGFNTSLVNNIDQFDPRTLFVYDEDYPSEMGESNTVSKDYVFHESMEGTEEPFIPLDVVSEDKFIPGQNKVQPEEWFVPVDAEARMRREAPSNDERDGSGEESWVIPVDAQARMRREAPSNDERDGSGEESLVIPVDAQARMRREAPSNDERDGSGEGSWVIPVDAQARMGREALSNDERDGSGEGSWVVSVDAQARKQREALSNDERDGSGEGSWVVLVDAQARKRKEAPSEQTLLYGIFQLRDITCNSGSSYSLDLCQLSCSALTDDDITDDIACLMGLDEKMVRMTFLQECLSVEPSDYFAECG
ncbi:uncharacterized protein LOC128602269 [Ictalurus furcatus]|uniref:uncharacterized protein LOC128602269 n=1 Tax=Ictalurus furcatus TaxID=66913 RepID=UPI002350FAD9|nr:uncharacterized protein LOC128602269 [Ictalurus furcatus]